MKLATRGPDRARRERTRPRGVGPIVVVAAAAGAAIAVQVPIAVALPLVALLGVFLVAEPSRAAVLVVALIFSNVVVIAVRFHQVPSPASLIVPMLLGLALAHVVLVQRRDLVVPHAIGWLVAFALIMVVGTAMSRDPSASSASLFSFAVEGFSLFVLLVNVVRTFETLRAASIALVLTAGLLGALTLGQELTGTNGSDYGGLAQMSDAEVAQDSPEGPRQRHAGPIGEQNRWAQSLVMVVPVAMALVATDRSALVRASAALCLPAIVAGIVLTYSRGAAVGVLLTLLVAVVLGWVRVRTAVVAVVVVSALLVVAAPVFVERATGLVGGRESPTGSPLDAPGPDGSVANRTTEGWAAVSVFTANPVFGVGTGMFPTYFQEEARRQGAERIVGVNREAHDLYLGLAAETGAAGLVAFCGIVVATLRPLQRIRRRRGVPPAMVGLATGYAGAVVSYLATGVFLHLAYARYFWLVLALAASTAMIGERFGILAPIAEDDAADAPDRVVVLDG